MPRCTLSPAWRGLERERQKREGGRQREWLSRESLLQNQGQAPLIIVLWVGRDDRHRCVVTAAPTCVTAASNKTRNAFALLFSWKRRYEQNKAGAAARRRVRGAMRSFVGLCFYFVGTHGELYVFVFFFPPGFTTDRV